MMAQEFEHLKSDQDVDEILRLAVNKSGLGGDLRSRLETSAEELGIPPEALAEAEAEYYQRRQTDAQERHARIRRRRAFIEHFVSYFGVNLLLIGIWYFTTHGTKPFWPIWPIMGWGLCGVLPHFVNAMILNKDEEEDEKQK
jgi:hypothetical protein